MDATAVFEFIDEGSYYNDTTQLFCYDTDIEDEDDFDTAAVLESIRRNQEAALVNGINARDMAELLAEIEAL